jgi:hypothetical protein
VVAPRTVFCARKDPRIHQPLTFLSQQSFGYCPRAKRSHSNTHAGVVGYLFETAHKAIAPMWQPGAYIRSCELSGVVERAHSNVARKTKGWVEHKIRHAVGTRELNFPTIGSGLPSLPKFASRRRSRARRFSLKLNNWSTKSSSIRLFRVNRYDMFRKFRLIMNGGDHGRLL